MDTNISLNKLYKQKNMKGLEQRGKDKTSLKNIYKIYICKFLYYIIIMEVTAVF
jgi:hypothetical protein